METIRGFKDTERYEFDFGKCSIKNGFAQLDTGQDASYFGIWANPFKRIVFTYCEGDTTLEKAESDDEFAAHIHTIKKFYDDSGYGFKGIDPGFNEPLKAKFQAVGLGHLLH